MEMRKDVKNTFGIVEDCRISSKSVSSVGGGVSPFYARLPYPPQYSNPTDWQNVEKTSQPEYRALGAFIADTGADIPMNEINDSEFVGSVRLKHDNSSKRPCLNSLNHQFPDLHVNGYQLRAMLALIGKEPLPQNDTNPCCKNEE